MSHWLIIIWLMYLILTAWLMTQPISLKWPDFSTKPPESGVWVMHTEFGLPMEKPNKTRFQRLATAIARAQNP